MEETPKAPSKANELRELQYRISQLEHLFVTASLNSPTVNNSLPSSDPLSLQTQDALIERISDLEGLLAASELENQNLRQELAVMDMDKKRDDVILLEKLYAKDREVERLQNEVRLLETKLKKSERAIENVKEYINTLPSQDELDEAKDKATRLESDNHVLTQKVSALEGRVADQERDLGKNKKLLEEQALRLEAVQPLEEAQTTILQTIEDGSFNFQDEKCITELITVQKAQIFRSSKLITTLREKLNQCSKEKGELQEKISNQVRDMEKLQEQLMVIQLTMEKTVQKLKNVEQEKMSLMEEKAELQETLQDRENFIKQRDTQFGNIIRLVTEIDLCVNDVKKLVELGECIVKGEEPPVASLLGLSDELEMHLQSLNHEQTNCYDPLDPQDSGNGTSSTSFNGSKNENSLAAKYLASVSNGVSTTTEEFSLGDMEWALDRIKKIRDLRQNIGVIRDEVNDMYTDIVGGKVEGCNVQ